MKASSTKELKLALKLLTKTDKLADFAKMLDMPQSQFYNMVESKPNLRLLKLLLGLQKRSKLEGEEYINYVKNLINNDFEY